MVKTSKLLSVVLTGRNDNYLGNFKYRINTAINFLSRSAKICALLNDIEIVVVDWNSESPLREALFLSRESAEICNFVEVPPHVAAKFHSDGGKFNTEVAINAGIRRAAGEFVLIMPADVLLNAACVRGLHALLTGQTAPEISMVEKVGLLSRKTIPWEVADKQLSIEDLDRYINLCARSLQLDRYFNGLAGGYGGLLAHRDIWYESEGFAEDNRGWGNSDLEWGLRVGQEYQYLDLDAFGVMSYDLSQKPDLTATRKTSSTMGYPNTVSRGNVGWGLKGHDFKVTRGELRQSSEPEPEKRQMPDARQALEAIGRIGTYNSLIESGIIRMEIGGAESVLIACLRWYCQTHQPMRLLDLSCCKGATSMAFAALCPYGEIYGFDDFETSTARGSFTSYIDSLPYVRFQDIGFRGYSTLITGDRKTAFTRLKKLFLGDLSYDVCVLRGEEYDTQANCITELDLSLEYLSKGGVMFISAKSPDMFSQLLMCVGNKYSEYFFLRSDADMLIMLIKRA